MIGSSANGDPDRQRKKGQDARRCGPFGDQHRRQYPEPRPDEAADEFAGSAAGEDQCQRDADFRKPGTFCPQQKRQEGEKTHPRRTVDDANGEKQGEAAARQIGAHRRLCTVRAVGSVRLTLAAGTAPAKAKWPRPPTAR